MSRSTGVSVTGKKGKVAIISVPVNPVRLLLVPRPGDMEDIAYSEEDAAIMETAQVQIGLR